MIMKPMDYNVIYVVKAMRMTIMYYVLEGHVGEDRYARNNQKLKPYSKTYNLGWKDHPNFKWSINLMSKLVTKSESDE